MVLVQVVAFADLLLEKCLLLRLLLLRGQSLSSWGRDLRRLPVRQANGFVHFGNQGRHPRGHVVSVFSHVFLYNFDVVVHCAHLLESWEVLDPQLGGMLDCGSSSLLESPLQGIVELRLVLLSRELLPEEVLDDLSLHLVVPHQLLRFLL